MGRPQWTSPPEAYSGRKFLRNALLAIPGILALALSAYALFDVVVGLTALVVGLVFLLAAWYSDKSRTE